MSPPCRIMFVCDIQTQFYTYWVVSAMNIGHKIKQRRKELKLTQVELAQKIKKSSQVVSNWERGYTPGITYEDLRNLSVALSVPVEYFMPDNSPEPMETPKPDKRLARIIKEYPSLDEKTKDMIDAIIKISKK